MFRGINKVCGYRGIFLEPYVNGFQLQSNHASTKQTSNVQNLPRLPVPKLSDTLNKYLNTVQPHLDEKEFVVTSNLVKEFGKDEGIGQKLQRLLEKRAETHTNWLEEWWLCSAYLEYRDPVVVFSSPGLVFPFRKFNNKNDQLQYAAKTLTAVLDYKYLVDSNKIPVEKMGKYPLDMSQYKKIFGTCRIPAEKRDKLSYNDSKYITVIHNNHIFHLDLWGEDNVRLNEDQIVQQLKKVIELSKTPADNGVGILTSENRDTWAKAYQLLVKDKKNKESLEDVERSIAVLCLDSAVGLWQHAEKDSRQTLAGAQTIHGGGSRLNGNNRWFDKTVQFIVGEDGVTGLTYEHSPAEGQPIAVLTDFIIDYISEKYVRQHIGFGMMSWKMYDKNKGSAAKPSSSIKDPIKLNFNVDSDVAAMIKTAKNNLDKLANDLELNCFTYNEYGKEFIKSQKLSPDSYIQMAMQYAFYSVHGKPGAHYESAATRMYAGGRTETIRSCSRESVRFATVMRDTSATDQLRLQAMRDAIQAHKDYTVQALQGFGVDRHLLGLKLIAIENGIELPKLYTDAGFVRSAHMRISTSQVSCKCDGFMCYGPLVADGYATCYNPRANDINLATSAWRTNADSRLDSYREALAKALTDMRDLLRRTTASKL